MKEIRARAVRLLEVLAVSAALIAVASLALALGPRLLGYSSFVVYGGSMEPTIAKGSVAVGKPVAVDSLKPDDVIAFQSGAASIPTIHRIIAASEVDGKRAFVTQGDANRTPDPETLALQGSGSKIVYSVPYVGYVIHAPRSLGQRYLVGLPAIGLSLIVLSWIWTGGSKPPPAVGV